MARDILIQESGEIVALNGDLVVGDSDVQNLQDLALLNRGDLKYDPLMGLDLIKLNKKRRPQVSDLGFISTQLKADGWIKTSVNLENGETVVRAERAE